MEWDRRISLIVSGVYLVVAMSQDPRWPIMAGYLLIPLLCIWYGDDLGNYIGPAGRYGWIDRPTPGIFVRVFGWFMLFLPAAVILYFQWHGA